MTKKVFLSENVQFKAKHSNKHLTIFVAKQKLIFSFWFLTTLNFLLKNKIFSTEHNVIFRQKNTLIGIWGNNYSYIHVIYNNVYNQCFNRINHSDSFLFYTCDPRYISVSWVLFYTRDPRSVFCFIPAIMDTCSMSCVLFLYLWPVSCVLLYTRDSADMYHVLCFDLNLWS